VGLAARLVDAGLRASLLLRGTVPGGTRAAAQQEYARELTPSVHPYYGRVTRDGGYTALQYWFFYAMNDWRSTFGGINDHEGDWEQVTVFLADGAPAWVAFSAHDLTGADLRRRADDPDLTWVGRHPVVYAGAGSHAGACLPGEYVTKLPLGGARLVGIPFLDYHRGDGPAIGPGTGRPWSPVLIDDDTAWVHAYRGLWGLDTHDRFGGERAPAGPRYERDGSVRAAWASPVSWAQLDGQPPTAAAAAVLRERRAARVEALLAALDGEIDGLREELREQQAARISRDDRELTQRLAVRGALREEWDALVRARTHPPPPEPPHAHLRHRPLPVVDDAPRRRFLAIWSATSVSVLLAGVALVLVFPPVGVFWSLVWLLLLMFGIEAAARARLIRFFGTIAATGLAAIGVWGLVLVVLQDWRIGVAAVLALTALALLVGNVRAWLAGR
jgi:hypothetical protein